MTWYPECAATPEDDGPNWTPPTIGNLMATQQSKVTRLREAEAHQLVAREARLFHERKALKYGVNTSRGMAHFKAAMGNTRESDGRLQEMFAQGGDPSAELPPKAVMKASKSAMQFHQKQAEKNGLHTPVGQAHVAAMQHHQAIHGKAKDQHQQMKQMKMQQQATQPRSPKVVKPASQGQLQKPMMASAEGGHGSGRHKGAGGEKRGGPRPFQPGVKEKIASLQKQINHHIDKGNNAPNESVQSQHHQMAGKLMDKLEALNVKYKREAAPGHSSKQSPVPVPKKSDQPSEDIRQDKPPIGLNPQDANKPGALRQLKQNETMGAHAGMIRAGGPGSGPRGGNIHQAQGKHSEAKLKQLLNHHLSQGKLAEKSGNKAKAEHHNMMAGKMMDKLDDLHSKQKKESRESRIRNFAREGGRGPYDNQDCTLPSKVKKQMKTNIVFRGKRTDEAQRSL